MLLVEYHHGSCANYCLFSRCFPHIVNLSCKAVLSAITSMEYAADNAPNYIPHGIAPHRSATFLDSISRDPIAMVRTLVRVVCNMFYICHVLLVQLLMV